MDGPCVSCVCLQRGIAVKKTTPFAQLAQTCRKVAKVGHLSRDAESESSRRYSACSERARPAVGQLSVEHLIATHVATHATQRPHSAATRVRPTSGFLAHIQADTSAARAGAAGAGARCRRGQVDGVATRTPRRSGYNDQRRPVQSTLQGPRSRASPPRLLTRRLQPEGL